MDQIYLLHREALKSLKRRIIDKCPICKGDGVVAVKNTKPLDHVLDQCECVKRFTLTKKKILANIPKKNLNIRVKNLKDLQVIRVDGETKSLYSKIIPIYTKSIIKNGAKGVGVIFFGPPGNGKTTAITVIASNIMRSTELSCYYIYFKDLIGLLMQSYDDRSKGILFREITSVDVLAIDELSLVSRVTPHMIAEFTSLCKQRHDAEKPTLLISNYSTIDEIEHNFGHPMASLLNEAFMPFKFPTRDFREKKFEWMRSFFE
jgi:DNA replication protein DnaC